MKEFQFTVPQELDDVRIDKCVSALMDSLSRSFIQKLIKDENVLLNGKTVKAGSKVSVFDELILYLPDAVEIDIKPENIPLDILYEDDSVLVVNKPKGMVVHPACGHYSGTLVNGVMYHCGNELSGINGVLRPGIVHRIDMDTTGSVIICKNDAAHNSIAAQLKDHSVNREYRAICHGVIKEDELVIDKPIGRNSKDRKKMAVVPGGKQAVTHVTVLERFEGFTYVKCVLETGRTHQIRVHLSSIGHPLLGDELYSGYKSPYKLQGQCLHAYKLGFIHPVSGEYVETLAPLPEYFQHLLNTMKRL
ncbi:MAG: RluA family pseudouridine synthase [Lachnospiraceae bacterium]|nr:RluA family pseudouridine synthase [Lachnospiraceae bacterium]